MRTQVKQTTAAKKIINYLFQGKKMFLIFVQSRTPCRGVFWCFFSKTLDAIAGNDDSKTAEKFESSKQVAIILSEMICHVINTLAVKKN